MQWHGVKLLTLVHNPGPQADYLWLRALFLYFSCLHFTVRKPFTTKLSPMLLLPKCIYRITELYMKTKWALGQCDPQNYMTGHENIKSTAWRERRLGWAARWRAVFVQTHVLRLFTAAESFSPLSSSCFCRHNPKYVTDINVFSTLPIFVLRLTKPRWIMLISSSRDTKNSIMNCLKSYKLAVPWCCCWYV